MLIDNNTFGPNSQEPNYDSVDEIISQTENELKETEATSLIEWGNIDDFLDNLPQAQEELFTSGAYCFAKGVVNTITASGGTGKSFYALELSMALATGSNFLKPWSPTKPVGVAYITAEDPKDKLNERIYWIYQENKDLQQKRELLSKNFKAVSLVGRDTRLLELDTKRNANISDFFKVLDDSLAILKTVMPELTVVFFDTLSRFYGLSENDNTLGALFVSTLESLSKKYNITPIILTHTSKDNRKSDVEDITARGAGSFIDNARFNLSMKTMDKKNKFKIKNYKDYVQVIPTKTNYTKGECEPQWLKRNEHGVLMPTTVAVVNDTLVNETIKYVQSYYTWNTEEEKADVMELNPLVLGQILDNTHPDRANKGVKQFLNHLKKVCSPSPTADQIKFALTTIGIKDEVKLVEVKTFQNKKALILTTRELEKEFSKDSYFLKNSRSKR